MEDGSKKDLTNLNELSKSSAHTEEDPFASNEGSAPVEPAFEAGAGQPDSGKIELFESLEELSKTVPPAEPEPSIESQEPHDEPAIHFGLDLATAEADLPPAEPSIAPAEPAITNLAEAKPGITQIRDYSEQMSPSQAPVQAAYPFSVMISGFLEPYERAKLLDVLSRDSFGIREVDLEPQFESGRILIPRISEFAAVVLIQSLRGTRAEIKFGPSDSIFMTEETQDRKPGSALNEKKIVNKLLEGASHPAELIPVLAEASIPGVGQYDIIDTLTASASLKTNLVEAERSPEYQEILEALQRKLKYMAYRKGAVAVVKFSVQLTPLFLPSRYKVLVMGEAIRPIESSSFPEPRLDA